MFITGASRGIGKAIALKCAKDGANIVIAAKTVQPHPKLQGTIYTAAKECKYFLLVFGLLTVKVIEPWYRTLILLLELNSSK